MVREITLSIQLDKGKDKYCVDLYGNGLNKTLFESKGKAIGYIVDWWTIHDG